MAKPRNVGGIDPDGRLRPNARRILAVRIDEVWSYEGDVVHPGRVTELHDMRIACKRLRYLLEIFAVAFTSDVEPLIDDVKGLQDLLGEIHDRDVQIPMLLAHLERLTTRDVRAARAMLAQEPRRTGRSSSEAAFRRFRHRLDAAGSGRERPGIEALLIRRTRERGELYERFLAEWRRLDAAGFRSRLEQALGI